MSGVRIWRADGPLGSVRRSGGEARELLQSAASPPVVQLYPRSDGPGSSQDLPQFAAMGNEIPGALDFEEPTWSWSESCLRTPGACLDTEPVSFFAVPAERAGAIEYYAPDFHDEPLRTDGVVPGRPELFVNNILAHFGLHGVRIEAAPMPAVYRGTGLGGSNLAHLGAVLLASALSGADLSLGQIFIYATLLENQFGVRLAGGAAQQVSFGVSLTGGQEALTALQGGVWDNVHLPAHYGPFAVASRELVGPERYQDLARHLLLVNVGRRRAPGVTSSGVNNAWMAAWRSAEGAARHLRKKAVAYRAAEALRLGDWAEYVGAIAEYRSLREQLCAGYVAGQEELAALCRGHGAEYFPLGAGTGTCLVAAADEGAIEAIRELVAATADAATGRTVLPFSVRSRGVELERFDDLGLALPSGPESV